MSLINKKENRKIGKLQGYKPLINIKDTIYPDFNSELAPDGLVSEMRFYQHVITLYRNLDSKKYSLEYERYLSGLDEALEEERTVIFDSINELVTYLSSKYDLSIVDF
jgi:hypothetical protein